MSDLHDDGPASRPAPPGFPGERHDPPPGTTAMIERSIPPAVPLPVGVGAIWTLGATALDLNYGALAGGVTVVGGALTFVYWNFATKRNEAAKVADAERLAASKAASAAELEAFKASEAAKLEVLQSEARLRIAIQKEQDEANKGSLSAQMAMVSGQLAAIQRSADEANRALMDAREMNKLLREQLDQAAERDAQAARRIEDANKKLHDIVNETNAKNLQHELEKQELQGAKDSLLRQLAEIQQSTKLVSEHIVPQVADNSARLDKLDGGA